MPGGKSIRKLGSFIKEEWQFFGIIGTLVAFGFGVGIYVTTTANNIENNRTALATLTTAVQTNDSNNMHEHKAMLDAINSLLTQKALPPVAYPVSLLPSAIKTALVENKP